MSFDFWRSGGCLFWVLLLTGCQTIAAQEPRRTKICIKNNSGREVAIASTNTSWSLSSLIPQNTPNPNPLSDAFNEAKISTGAEICREQEVVFDKRVPSFDLAIEGVRSTLHYYSGFGDLTGWGSDCDWSKSFCLRGVGKAKFYDGTVEFGESCPGSECFRFTIEKTETKTTK
jgi:hypothetical protein